MKNITEIEFESFRMDMGPYVRQGGRHPGKTASKMRRLDRIRQVRRDVVDDTPIVPALSGSVVKDSPLTWFSRVILRHQAV